MPYYLLPTLTDVPTEPRALVVSATNPWDKIIDPRTLTPTETLQRIDTTHHHALLALVPGPDFPTVAEAVGARRGTSTGEGPQRRGTDVVFLQTFDEWNTATIRADNEPHDPALTLPGEWTSVRGAARARLSKDLSAISYYPAAQYQYQDRRMTLSYARFLAKYYTGVYSDDRQRDLVNALRASIAARTATQFFIARTADEIAAAYVHGPGSCMSGQYFPEINPNPARAYGDTALGVAYLGTITGSAPRVIARAVVWPNRMRYARIYGDVPVLQRLLHEAGYAQGTLDGVKIRALKDTTTRHARNTFWCPYVDYIEHAELSTDEDGTQWFNLIEDLDSADDVDEDAIYTVQHTTGHAIRTEISRASCHLCYDRLGTSDERDRGTCDGCDENQWTCESCGHESYDPEASCHDGHQTLCSDCYNELAHVCVVCGDVYWDHEDGDDPWLRCRACRASYSPCETCHEVIAEDDLRPINEDGAHCRDCRSRHEAETIRARRAYRRSARVLRVHRAGCVDPAMFVDATGATWDVRL